MTNEDTLREMLNKKERENERLLMRILELCSDNANLKKENEELKKKATEYAKDKNYYIRQGLVPKNEQSTIGNGCIGDGYEIVGYEKGVSCWRAYKDGDKWSICFPSNPTKTTFTDFEMILHRGYRSFSKPILLITGDEVGKGSDGEPLLKNVKVIKELDEDTEFINLDLAR